MGEISVEELDDQERQMFKVSQEQDFKEELKCIQLGRRLSASSFLRNMNPFIDIEGLLRGNTRIINAKFLDIKVRYPILLSENSWIAWLLVKEKHLERKHCGGTQHILNDVQKQFWIPKVRMLIQKVETQCGRCQRKRAKVETEIMAPLPSFRFNEPLRPFARVGVDYAGPIATKQGRGLRREKRYICLFTCLQIRAVHLELAFSLDTDSFIRALKRFIGRRGKPEMLLSDNGTNFVGAANEINEIQIDGYKLKRYLSNEKISWVFNPPSAAHFGGIFEALIKSVKRALKIILENADVTDEELQTVLIEVESFVNSRPIGRKSSDMKEDDALTPNHFLIGGNWSDGYLSGKKYGLKTRWKRVQELSEHIWKRWMEEIVPMWSPRQKWQQEQTPLKLNDVVWVLDRKNKRRGHRQGAGDLSQGR